MHTSIIVINGAQYLIWNNCLLSKRCILDSHLIIGQSSKSHNSSAPYPTIPHFVWCICGIWDRCFVGFVRLLSCLPSSDPIQYVNQGKSTIKLQLEMNRQYHPPKDLKSINQLKYNKKCIQNFMGRRCYFHGPKELKSDNLRGRWAKTWLLSLMRFATNEYLSCHYNDVIMTPMASQITSPTVVYSIVYSDADQRKHQSSASLALFGAGEFPELMASNAENVFIWWRHHVFRAMHNTCIL